MSPDSSAVQTLREEANGHCTAAIVSFGIAILALLAAVSMAVRGAAEVVQAVWFMGFSAFGSVLFCNGIINIVRCNRKNALADELSRND